MRISALLLILGLTTCTTAPNVPQAQVPAKPDSVRFFDQGWSAGDRQVFTSTPQGSHLMPLPWFKALRRTDIDAPFIGDGLARYGYLPGTGALPVGFVPDGDARAPQVGMTCAACHTGQLNIKGVAWRIDGGRSNADFQAFLTDLGSSSRSTLDDPVRFAAFAAAVLGPGASPAATDRLRDDLADWTGRYTGFMDRSLPDPAWGPGRLDAFGMIFNRVVGLDLGSIYDKADAPVRYPFIWDAPRQDHTQWTGVARNGTYLRALARNTGEVFGVFGVLTPKAGPHRTATYENRVNLGGLQTLEEKLVALRAPQWPEAAYGLDRPMAARGSEVFAAACSGCHASGPSTTVRNAWSTPLVDTGTDRRTFDRSQRSGSPGPLLGTQQPPLVGDRLAVTEPKASILANAVIGSLERGALRFDPAIRRAIGRDFAEDRLPLLGPAAPSLAPAGVAADVANATKDLYKARDGAPGAAYEARRLTGIWAVAPYLHNGSVASLRELLTPPAQRMTRFAVGHHDFDPVNVGLETGPGPERATFVVDETVGNGNGGHAYGTDLLDADKRALIEYLKTL